MEFFGVRLVGVNTENGQKLLLTLALGAILIPARWLVASVVRLAQQGRGNGQARFWARQAVNLGTALFLLLGLLSIWFDDPTRLATAAGLVTAGLAFALQRVVTAIAGYFASCAARTSASAIGSRWAGCAAT